jgi:DNA-directed RNA polymerase subunit M/transcription elongation factor TFIIS
MRCLINYIRSCFCEHDMELIIDNYMYPARKQNRIKVYRCKKCGYSQKYEEW